MNELIRLEEKYVVLLCIMTRVESDVTAPSVWAVCPINNEWSAPAPCFAGKQDWKQEDWKLDNKNTKRILWRQDKCRETVCFGILAPQKLWPLVVKCYYIIAL